jgi:hypothetical protein
MSPRRIVFTTSHNAILSLIADIRDTGRFRVRTTADIAPGQGVDSPHRPEGEQRALKLNATATIVRISASKRSSPSVPAPSATQKTAAKSALAIGPSWALTSA